MDNGRCKAHGGKTPKAITDIMRHQKSEYLPSSLYARFEALDGTALDNLEESLRMQQTLETSIIERLETGESALLWGQLTELLASVSLVDDGLVEESAREDEITRLEKRVAQLEEVIEVGKGMVLHGGRSFAVQKQLRQELQQAHEAQRKLAETLTKCRKEMQETYTEEQWNAMLLGILEALKRHVDAPTLAAVATEWAGTGHVKALTK